MTKLSDRINSIEGSGIRKVFELAAKAKGDCINLSIGQPDFAVSKKLKIAANRAIDFDHNYYTSTAGTTELKKQIAKKLTSQNNIKASEDEIIVTAGVSGAIFLALSAIIDPGDEIILPDPYFVVYDQIIKFLGGKVILLDTYPTFHIDAKKLEKLITSKTKAIIINTPSNPTGSVCSLKELEEISAVALDHDLLIISDEIYEYFNYTSSFISIASIYKNTLTLNGFSKSHAITGWRVGYAHGPVEIIDAMNKLQQYTFVCAPSFAQHALAMEFEIDRDYIKENYTRKKDLIVEGLKDKYEFNEPEGAFYAFIKIPNERPNFIEELAKAGVLCVPGNIFSQKSTHFRLCFAAPDEILKKGIKILRNLV